MPRMTTPAPTEVVLVKGEEKKHSWRFDAPARASGEPAPMLTSAYVNKDTLAALGDPQRVRLSIAVEQVE